MMTWELGLDRSWIVGFKDLDKFIEENRELDYLDFIKKLKEWKFKYQCDHRQWQIVAISENFDIVCLDCYISSLSASETADEFFSGEFKEPEFW